jgi:parallel beta-helix repeat protein
VVRRGVAIAIRLGLAAIVSLSSARGAAVAPLAVTQCGAAGDGKTNDTKAFEQAFASGAKDVYVPPGIYVLGPGMLTIPADTYLHGAGAASVMRLAEGTAELFALRENVSLDRLAIDGGAGKRGEINDAVVLLRGANRARLDRLSFADCDRVCIGLDHADDVTIQGCDFRKVGAAVCITFSNRTKVLDNTVVEARIHGIQFWGNWRWETQAISDVTITGNYLKNAGGGPIWGTGATRVVLANNIVDGAKDVGLDLEWCSDSVITGNTARNCANAGISLFFACRRISITGNTVMNDAPIADPKASWWVRSGIWLTYPNTETFKGDAGHRDVTIVGNTIYCAPGERRAMWIGSGSENITIADNTLHGGEIWQGGAHKVDPPPPLHKVEQNTVLTAGDK